MTYLLMTSNIILVIALSAHIILRERSEAKWMRLFSEKQGVSFTLMEGDEPEKPKPAEPKPQKRVMIPVPGSEFFRKTR